ENLLADGAKSILDALSGRGPDVLLGYALRRNHDHGFGAVAVWQRLRPEVRADADGHERKQDEPLPPPDHADDFFRGVLLAGDHGAPRPYQRGSHAVMPTRTPLRST